MSSTNRGAVRRPNDLYETPEEVTRDFLLNHFEGDYKAILEPCAGTGKMVKVLRERYPNAVIDCIDIDDHGDIPDADHHMIADYLEHRPKLLKYNLIFTNPPFSLAKEIIAHTLALYPNTTVVMLLRLAFLESANRFEWWQDKLPTEVHVLANRPSFTDKGTDATAYAWFIWRPEVKTQKIGLVWGRT